jgi:hypothetical protein
MGLSAAEHLRVLTGGKAREPLWQTRWHSGADSKVWMGKGCNKAGLIDRALFFPLSERLFKSLCFFAAF